MDAAPAVDQMTKFSAGAFIKGLAVAGVFYLLLTLWLLFNAGAAEEKLSQRLASQTVIVEWKTESTKIARKDEIFGPPRLEDMPSTVYSDPEYLESGLTEAPVDGLYETTPFGRKPIIRRQDDLTPFQAYKRPFDIYASGGKAVISIAVAGLGLSDVATESAVRSMPPEVSFIVSPYSETIDFWVRESRSRGHEVWLTLPVEAEDYPVDDPGPHTILISAPERENLNKLDWLMTRVDGYAGFVTNFETAFIQSANDMRPVIGAIYNSGIGFIDGSSDPSLIPQTMAVGMKAPYASVDMWLDKPDATQASIAKGLKELEETAKKKGYAVGIIHPLPVSYQQVQNWIKTLAGKDFVLAPLSATTGY